MRAMSRYLPSFKKLKVGGAEAVAIGDTPYDAEAAGKAKIAKTSGPIAKPSSSPR
jgi:phosphoglycolate phosphatase-like HAD superfamily hydrolase